MNMLNIVKIIYFAVNLGSFVAFTYVGNGELFFQIFLGSSIALSIILQYIIIGKIDKIDKQNKLES